MLSAEQIEQLYDFEGAFDTATVAVLQDMGLETATRKDAATIDDRPVPRVEVQFRVGDDGNTEFKCPDGKRRHITFKGQLALQVVTEVKAGDPGNVHGAYRAKVRYLCSTLPERFNDPALLPNHRVAHITGAGATSALKTHDGIEYSTLLFNVEFSIRPGAWPQAE